MPSLPAGIAHQLAVITTPANKQKIKSLALSGAIYAGAGLVGFLFVTDWKIVMKKIPFYNRKFEEPKV